MRWGLLFQSTENILHKRKLWAINSGWIERALHPLVMCMERLLDSEHAGGTPRL